ncbi:MAG: reverse transcriptase family protein [Bacteroidaceae bacterium]|nr:reverse transcriptase family protein [Bacteroidaceae bacterium]
MTQEQIRKAITEIHSSKDLLFLLNSVKKDIYGEKYHPFCLKLITYYCNPSRATRAYKHFKIAKKSGGFREISAPTKSLKSIQTCLNVIFQALYEPSDIAQGFLPGKSVVDNSVVHKGMNYVFNTDIKDFFPSISQARIWAVLQIPPMNFPREAANIIAGLCCMRVENAEASCDEDRFKYVLPQGSPCSPILTNIVCRKLDHRLKGLAKRFDLNCTRYADDITFSSSHNVYQKDGEFMMELRHIINDQNFRINEGKTRLQGKSMRQEVTGLVVNSKVNVTRQFTRELQSLLFIWERYGYEAAFARFSNHYTANKPNDVIMGTDYMIHVIKGKMMYMKMIKGKDDPSYLRLSKKFDSLIGNKADQNTCGIELVYTISTFEKEYHTSVQFQYKKADTDHSPENLGAVTRFQKKNIWVILSKSCRNSVDLVLNGKSDLTFKQLKEKFYIVKQTRANGKSFWMIENGDPRLSPSTTQADFIEENGIAQHKQAKGNGAVNDVAISSVLQKLIENNFTNLSILSEWDRENKN